MNLRCLIFGHQFIQSFKYMRCLRCGLVVKKSLPKLERELDESAKVELETTVDYLLLKSQLENK